jgi:hypothetical protein
MSELTLNKSTEPQEKNGTLQQGASDINILVVNKDENKLKM